MSDLTKLFQKDNRIFADGKLLKNKLTELALKLDPPLIEMLLSDKKAKKHFFLEKEIKKNKVLIFDKDKFIAFVNNKEFLPDSFTSFKNKIGLMTNGDYLKEKGDVVLAWAYKDCVLEGGQDKEDQKRTEIFYNETLSPDEIDRLFEPKVLTNFKKYDSKGEHKLYHLNHLSNLLLKGNNLLVLHSLEKILRGGVKFIYIDPPYNLDNDSFRYNDRFTHSSWLTFMKNRLEIAKELLNPKGVIFVQIGDEEEAYLKVLCDEIFSRENFIATITRVAKTASNKGTFFAPSTDFVLCYAKDKNQLPEFYDAVDENLYKKTEKDGSRKGENYRDDVAFYQSSLDTRPNQRYYIKCPDGSLVLPPGKSFPVKKEDTAKANPKKGDGVWRWAVKAYKENRRLMVYKKTKRSPLLDENGNQAKWNIYTKSYLSDRQKTGTKPRNFLDQFINRKGADYIKNLDVDFDYPKPVELIEWLIRIVGVEKNDIVLDFFAGSGTTAEAVLRVNRSDDGHRRFILCEQMDYVNGITAKRIQKILAPKEEFIYFELKCLNEAYINDLKKAKTTKTLFNIYEKMKKESFFRYDVELSKFNEKEFEKLSLKEQKQVLCECLDKNHLYVNLSEIDDEEYRVSEEEKKLNKGFYKD